MQNIIALKAIKDFFTGQFLLMSIAPFIVPVIILGSFFIYGGNEFITMLSNGAQSGNFAFLDENVYPISSYILSFSVIQWLLIGLFAVIGTLGVLLTSLVIAILTVGFMTPFIVKIIKNKYYVDISAGIEHNILRSLGNILKIFLQFFLFLLCTIPFLFIPFLNFIFFQVPFFYLFYRLMIYDILSCGISENVEKIIKENRIYLFIILLLFFFFSLIPFIGLFLQVFIIIYLSHYILTIDSNRLQKVTNLS